MYLYLKTHKLLISNAEIHVPGINFCYTPHKKRKPFNCGLVMFSCKDYIM